MTRAFVLLAGAALIVAPASLSAQATRSISASDKAQGAQANPELLKQFGGSYNGPQAAYVERIGKRIALQSGLSNSERDFTVTLLNSPVENAFAIPGGYVYVTRQLLALMNSEAELAFVLGHEVGHVAARHSSKRNTRSTIGSILAAGAGLLTGSDTVGRLVGTGSKLYTLGFSRSQEYEADTLGVNYLVGSGYSPFAAPTMLAQLNAETTLDARIAGRDANAVPSWMSTHPNGAERVVRARQLATQRARGPAPTAQDTQFLRILDGLRYDDDPSEGVIEGQTFRHPVLKLRFTAPTGYTIANGSESVTVQGTGGQAVFRGAAATSDLSGFVTARMGDIGVRPNASGVRRVTLNGQPAAMATTTAVTNGQRVDASVVAYSLPSATYWFTIVTRAGAGVTPFQTLLSSFAPLSTAETNQVRGKRIRVVAVRAGDTIDSLAGQMAYPNFQRERFMTLNGLANGAALRPGTLVKLVVAG